ncbi:DEAD/DEAH box helicase [Nocardia sp. NPDC052278]|uniref:DEAD/DEAH box helicase n=1 Tax=unclassified Nocardia TaxID=2637762 RepID=UPI00368396C4
MTDSLDPLATSGLVVDSYRRYLRSLLPVRDPQIAKALADEITASPMLTKGPILEATPPYATGSTLAGLIGDGVLDSSFRRLAGPALPLDRPLYKHQEQALRKAAAGRNLVVATGTGSGKTESFLLPILASLMSEHARGELGPGVRALLLYPMNALANDQLKRLRQLLADVPEITFGRYTGDTPEYARDAAEKFELLNPGESRLPNELLSRDEMRAEPPHLLLTNYAMLEYLLLRPADIELFEGRAWRFIALDEAHVYDGAKAAELAMLLRRLHERVASGRELQCIATSATVGDDPTAVVDFAEKLFNVPFEWHPTDASRQDLVTATRQNMPSGQFWGPLDGGDYRKLAQAQDIDVEVLQLATDRGFASDDPGFALAHEQTMAGLRSRLAAHPVPFGRLADMYFGDDPAPATALAAAVAVGAAVRNRSGAPVMSARYHLFTRATEGAFTCLSSQPHVSLGRHEECTSCHLKMFEFGACKQCGAVHLTGAISGGVFSPRVSREDRRVWMLLGDSPVLVDEDDAGFEDLPDVTGEARYLCITCGALGPVRASCGHDNCRATEFRPVLKLNLTGESPSGCAACGARGAATIRQFESGSDAAAAVLATALYQSLPPATDDAVGDRPGEGRKLLTFSDSRQAAAFFAPYLESSYSTIQRRRLILEGMQAAVRRDESARIDDVVYHVAKAADTAHVFQRRDSRQQRERVTSLWIMQELVTLDDRLSLEGLGLMRVNLDRDPQWKVPSALTAMGLSADESWDLLSELLRTLRRQGAVKMPDEVDPRDEAFDPRRGPIYVREDGAEPARKVLSWLPTRGVNRRLDYMRRVLSALGSAADPTDVLRGCWKLITAQRDSWLTADNVRSLGVVRQLDSSWFRLEPVTSPVYRCRQCRRIAAVSVRGVCPTMGCIGALETFMVPSVNEDDQHYRQLFRSMIPVPMTAREHTAQWTSEEAADIQQQFVRGDVNVLSCSTTFELGVDVGELQSVVLRNMPPTTANYVQRAGRAGRRTDSAALVVTYAQRRSHDLTRYSDPVSMIAGEVRAPYVPLGNERIDRRHAHSIALAAYFRAAKEGTGETWSTAGDFFLGDPAPASHVRAFLTPVPPGVQASLKQVLPTEVQGEIGVDTGEWVAHLVGILDAIKDQLSNDVAVFEEKRQRAYDERKDHLINRFAKTINTLTKRNLIGYLANHNVLPKYGFPVDTVELRTSYSDSPVGAKLELTRDLSAAIYEYAPGAEVVAGGVQWTSGGVYRLPDRELVGKSYFVCEGCQHFWEDDEIPSPTCPACSTFQTRVPRQYVIPEFGFVAQSSPARTSGTPPKRSWNGATHVLSLAAEELTEHSWLGANGGEIHSRAGSRGRLIAVSEGHGGSGFLICDWCGAGTTPGLQKKSKSKSHTHLLKGTECTGPMRWRSLAHAYETDLLDLSFNFAAMPVHAITAHWRSVLYALLEGAAERLELSRDDIDGTLYQRPGGRTGIVLYDAVPGGAGSVLRIANNLDRVFAAALDRVSNCDCGEETSCYGCLRSFGNQQYHDQLGRRAAVDVLRPLVGLTTRDRLVQ